jgi:steroid delta-isomerase-like uncharacterized protein
MTANLSTYVDAIHDACNSHDSEKILRLCSPDYTGSDVSQPVPLRGLDDLRLMLERFWTAFPDLRFVATEMIMQGSRLALVWVAEGTHQGPIMNIPPTGRRVEVRGISIIDVKDGLLIRGQSIWDLAGMLRHLGLLPEL